MYMFKFIHAADIHLDSPLRGLEQYEGAPTQQIREAARRALANLVELAVQEHVAFVIIAGDLYDGDWRHFNTGLYFIDQARKLQDSGIDVYLIAGNHDAANRMTKSLNLPTNVTFFASDAPSTVYIKELHVAIHGQSFASAAVSTDLSESYPLAHASAFNIGILHTCASGREGHERYAPCSVEGLKLKGYDYWALGHIHLRETLCERPFIAFSGNIQGRHIRETGPKGCLLVTVSNDYAVKTEFRPLDVVRWEIVQVDVSAATTIEEVLTYTSDAIESRYRNAAGRTLAIRIELTGQTAVHDALNAKRNYVINEFRSLASQIGRGEAWIEKVKVNTSKLASGRTSGMISDDAMGELGNLFDELKANPTKLDEFKVDLSDCLRKLPGELKESLPPTDPDWIQGVIAEAESRLFQELLSKESNP